MRRKPSKAVSAVHDAAVFDLPYQSLSGRYAVRCQSGFLSLFPVLYCFFDLWAWNRYAADVGQLYVLQHSRWGLVQLRP